MVTNIKTARNSPNTYAIDYDVNGSSNKLTDLNYELREKILLKLLDSQLSTAPTKVKEIKYIKASR